MEHISGNIFVRTQPPMKKGEEVVSHRHNFDHTTYVNQGKFLIEVLTEEKEVVSAHEVSATDEVNWFLIVKGTYHRLTSLEDGSVYHCIYSHRKPQALTMPKGAIDVLGADGIIQEANGFEEAYR